LQQPPPPLRATWSHAPSELAGSIRLADGWNSHQHFGLAPNQPKQAAFFRYGRGGKPGMTSNAEWCYDLLAFGELASNR